MRNRAFAIAITALIVWTASLVVRRLSAQEIPDDARPAVRGALTDASMVKMLTDMGFEPKKLKQGYVVAIKQGEWTYNVQLLISPNREKIGLNANMGSVEDPATVTANQWMNLLAANTDTAPSFFYYNKNNKTLYMHRVLDNRAVTSAILRQQVDAFTTNIKDSADAWNFTK